MKTANPKPGKMLILSITVPMDVRYGGPPQAIKEILVSLSKLNWNCSLIVAGQSGKSKADSKALFDYLESSSIRVTSLGFLLNNVYGFFIPFQSKKIVSSLKEVDLVLFHQIYTFANLFFYFKVKSSGIPYVVMPHGSLTNYHEKHHAFRKRLYMKVFGHRFLENCEQILVASLIEGEQVNRKFQEKVRIVGLGIPKEITTTRSVNAKREEKRVLFLGRITSKKRLDLVISAVAELINGGQPVCLDIAGTGKSRLVNKLHKQAVAMNIEKSVLFHGWVVGVNKKSLMHTADYFVLPSEEENFAIAVAECLAVGIPCIVSRNVALSSLVETFHAGAVIEQLNSTQISNAIFNLVRENQDILANNALVASQELNWDRVAIVWDKVLRELVN